MFLTGEALFCSILETQYDAFIALVNNVIAFPQQAIGLILSFIQSTTMLIFEVIRTAVIALEQMIINYLEFDGFDLSQTKENICQVAWDCAFLRNKLLDTFGLAHQETNFDKFEDIICKQGLRGFFENWVSTELLGGIDETLIGFLQQINEAYNKVSKKVDEGMDYLLNTPIYDGKSFYELMEELDKYVQCTFSTCNWAETAFNQQEDYLDKLSVARSEGGGFIFVADYWDDFTDNFNGLTDYINSLRNKLATQDTFDTARGIQPDDLAR
jgi:hypothetical protein